MDLSQEITEELKIREDINLSLDIYKLDNLVTEDEINEGLLSVTDLCKKFRHVHVDLKNKIDNSDYDTKYPDYKILLDQLVNFIKEAKMSLRNLKEKNSYLKEGIFHIEKLKIDEELLDMKVKQVGHVFILETVENVRDIDEYVVKVEAFINEYFDLYGKFKYCIGVDGGDSDVYSKKLVQCTENLHAKICEAKIFRNKILCQIDEKMHRVARDIEIADSVSRAKNLNCEIQLRFSALKNRYSLNFKSLSDYQLLELGKDKSSETEFNGFLDKITDLSSLVSVGGGEVEKLFDMSTNLRDEIAKLKEKFLKDLQSAILDRDISDGKLKSASTLKIELPKFSGYSSKMDIYTFMEKFQKFVEPNVRKQYLAEYLKRNYLSEPASTLVESITDYTKIWERLIESFGNVRLMLQNKLESLDRIGGLWKVKGDEKIGIVIASLINSMNELSSLASHHDIEGQLYEGGGLEKVMILIGENRHRKFRKETLRSKLSKKEEWTELLEFLHQELLLRERLTLDSKTAKVMGFDFGRKDKKFENPRENLKDFPKFSHFTGESPKCHICEKMDHTSVTTSKGAKIVPYYCCELFVRMSPSERLQKLKSKNLCIGCIYPGALVGPKHKCFFTNFCCPNPSHEKNKRIHVLLCDSHKSDSDNKKVLDKFKEKFIKNSRVELPMFTKHLSCFSEMVGVSNAMIQNVGCVPLGFPSEADVMHSGLFQLQTIEVDGIKLNLFFDTGCGDMVVRKASIDKLKVVGRAKQILPGPIPINGVGSQTSVSHDGIYSVSLPLFDGGNAIISGLCLPKVTTEFPLYPLDRVARDIRGECEKLGGLSLVGKLPDFPKEVGGDTDILIGIKYAKYFPKLVFEFKSGLGVYESVFQSSDGSRGVISGPHEEFSKSENKGLHVKCGYFFAPVIEYRDFYCLENEMPLLGNKADFNMKACDPIFFSEKDSDSARVMDQISENLPEGDDISCASCVAKYPPKSLKKFDEIEDTGTAITYRCVDCRNCPNCKKGAQFESVSIQEEMEQQLIEQCVHVDIDRGITTAKLPFLTEPDTRIVPNMYEALKVYRAQVKKLNCKPEDKISVLDSERKLQKLGFVDFFSNLSDDERKMILDAVVRYFIPWRAVWNIKSLSTPCRIVFDASQSTRGGCSLNSLLAKGVNGMNKLVEMLIRWTIHRYAFHTDIQKMYNAVRLDKGHWRYQLYLWDDELSEDRDPVWKVIKTLIYGVRPSGNLAECGLRRTAELCRKEFPRAYGVIMNDMYVDDCFSGGPTWKDTLRITDEVKIALEKGGFSLKGFSFSGHDPLENLSHDKESVIVGGIKWFPKGDFIQLNISELNFNKKMRGRKVINENGIQKIVTKRDCVSRVSEVFDPLGWVSPILGGMKIDISELHKRNLKWDDPIPDELKTVWAANFDTIEELGNIMFERAIVPEDALNLNIQTVDMADASLDLICAAVYARFKRKDGSYSCQLVFSRTKIVHDITIPRAELMAAVLNASTGFVVRRSFGDLHKKSWKLTDSQVVLHWINCTKSALKTFVRNRVVEISRLVDRSDWFYVDTENNIADLGTRKGVNISDVGPGSPWIQGLPWMRGDETEFPLKTVEEIILSSKEKGEANNEKVIAPLEISDESCLAARYVPREVGDRFKFSKYLIGPNRYRFRTVVRILGIVILFIKKLNDKCKICRKLSCLNNTYYSKSQHVLNGQCQYIVSPIKSEGLRVYLGSKVNVLCLSEDILSAARSYFFRKASDEIKRFVDPCKYEKKSAWKDGILYFTGRILPVQDIDDKIGLGDTMLDLSASTFCVPMTDSRSPIAYAIVSETHWYDPDVKHGGVESLLRYSQKVAYIIDGRDLAKNVKKECAKCRILYKKAVRVAMGPVGESNLKVAPAFYYCQVDICGPFSAYSPVNKRATIKVWFVVFCCTVTSTVDCRVMEDYSADAFVLAFGRFACRFGYPKMLMPDEGSQLVKGCKDVVISHSDIKHRLSTEHGVEFRTCPVGAHYVHGKVERKIKEIKRSLTKEINNNRLSVLQWESLGQQVANCINNMPIGLGNKTDMLDSLDILTPNRLILGRNNNRNPVGPLAISNDHRHIIESNKRIFSSWFREWLVSYVPGLVQQPKWFVTNRNICVGDIVLFLKSEKEFDLQYQYGVVSIAFIGRDGLVRAVEVEYQNFNEKVKRKTRRGVREIVVIHPIDEIGLNAELHELECSE